MEAKLTTNAINDERNHGADKSRHFPTFFFSKKCQEPSEAESERERLYFQILSTCSDR